MSRLPLQAASGHVTTVFLSASKQTGCEPLSGLKDPLPPLSLAVGNWWPYAPDVVNTGGEHHTGLPLLIN